MEKNASGFYWICGAEQALVNQIIAKLNKGMDIPSIAEMLETEEDDIKELIEKHELMAVKSWWLNFKKEPQTKYQYAVPFM